MRIKSRSAGTTIFGPCRFFVQKRNIAATGAFETRPMSQNEKISVFYSDDQPEMEPSACGFASKHIPLGLPIFKEIFFHGGRTPFGSV